MALSGIPCQKTAKTKKRQPAVNLAGVKWHSLSKNGQNTNKSKKKRDASIEQRLSGIYCQREELKTEQVGFGKTELGILLLYGWRWEATRAPDLALQKALPAVI